MEPPMESSDVEQQWLFARSVEVELLAKLKEREPLFDHVERLVQQLRVSCEITIFTDFEFATSNNIESRLWDAHGVINARYRKILNHFKTDEPRKHVEKRKWQKRYADFIKSSQFFYKGYIQRLSCRFHGRNGGPLVELRKIAHELDPKPKVAAQQTMVSDRVAELILASCHATLLHLGDLSRYRNDIRVKDRSWDVAMQYYSLANDLNPDSGSAFNQMAVIALADTNHLDAVYYLYRSLAVKNPYPVGSKNLEIEFKKIASEWEKEKVGRKSNPRHASPSTKNDTLAPLTSWFVRLHAKLYKGEEFAGYDELENEVLSQLTVLLKEQSLSTIMAKLVLINITSEFYAGERLQEKPTPSNFQSFYFLLRLNARMMFMLLQVLQPELEAPKTREAIQDRSSSEWSEFEGISAVACRILPAMRHYSIWLTTRAAIIASQAANPLLGVQVKELWKMYAVTLTMLVNAFPVDKLPVLDYLLEEDQETMGFKPFRDNDSDPGFDVYTAGGRKKPRMTDPGVERAPVFTEMQARIRGLLKDGVNLACGEKYPVRMHDGQFFVVEEGVPVSSPVREPRATAESKYAPPVQPASHTGRDIASSVTSDSHPSLGADAHRMVDDLVEGHSEISRARPVHGASASGPQKMSSSSFATPVHPGHTGDMSSRPLASLPGIFSSPFTPRPNELGFSTPERPSSSRAMSPGRLSPLPSSGRSFAAEAASRAAWGQDVSPPTRPLSKQDVMQEIQNNLALSFQQQASISPTYNSSAYSNRLSPVGASFHTHDPRLRPPTSYERQAVFNSSTWNDNPSWMGQMSMPPGGQGG